MTQDRDRFSRWLQGEWYRLSPWQLLLLPLAAIYWLISTARRRAYALGLFPGERLPVPVVVVGNITVGGAGKTPLTIALVEILRQGGFTPGVVSRGYGGTAREPTLAYAHSDPARVGDEPVVIAQRAFVPMCVGRDRVAAARKLLDARPETNIIVSDDGLQHYRLQRDVEVVVIDGARGLGNGLLLPAGPLREGKSRLKAASAVVLHNAMPTSRVDIGVPGIPPEKCHSMRLSGQVFYNVRNPERRVLPADLKNKTLHAIAGIAHPERFFAHLKSLGLAVVARPFPDHHAFSREDLALPEGYHLLMTEKDAVKCKALATENCWSLPVTAEFDADFAPFILTALKKIYGPQTA
jgi:tetraacyldisaccharide 4'-kinase